MCTGCLKSILLALALYQLGSVTGLLAQETPSGPSNEESAEIEFIAPISDGTRRSKPATPRQRPEYTIRDRDEFQDKGLDRKIILYRVDPPEEPEVDQDLEPKPEPMPAPQEMTLEEFEAYRKAHPRRSLSLAATIFDHDATLLRWRDEGELFLAWSNVDFHHLAGLSNYRVRETTYSLFMLPEATKREWEDPDVWPGHPPAFEIEEPHLVLIEGDGTNAEALKPILELLEIYAKRGDRLREAYEGRVRAAEERKAELKRNPPQPKDFVIYHWRGEGFEHLPPFEAVPSLEERQPMGSEDDPARVAAREQARLARVKQFLADRAAHEAKKAERLARREKRQKPQAQ